MPSAPRRRHTLGPHRPLSVRHHGEDHASVIVAGPTALCPRTRTCALPTALLRRVPAVVRATRRGPAGQATRRACMPIGSPDAPHTPPSSHSLGRSSEPPLRARRRRRRSSLVRPTVHRPSSNSSTTNASTRIPWTLLCMCIGWPTRLLSGIAAAAADRRPPRCRPSPEPFPAEPTPPIDQG
jgi:hypothetical protein